MSTPAKYVPEPREWEDKATLRELYWGDELLCVREIAERFDVGHWQIRTTMDELGIPRRPVRYKRDNSISPFTGFYRHRSAPTDENSRTVYDPEFESADAGEFRWSFEEL